MTIGQQCVTGAGQSNDMAAQATVAWEAQALAAPGLGLLAA